MPDINLEDNKCADIKGNCTLRAAIQNANKTEETDNVYFNIPGDEVKTILLKENLPPITETIRLDATTQPGYTWSTPKILISGSELELINVEEETPRDLIPQGFFLTGNSSGSLVKGFILGGFGLIEEDEYGSILEYYLGIAIQVLNSGNHTIQSNFIGVQADGITPFRNIFGMYTGSRDGFADSRNNLIGGTESDDANVIGGSWRSAILLGYKSGENEVRGNYIGIGANGSTPIINSHGVSVSYPSYNNIIDANLISGNYVVGIHLVGGGNIVTNNTLGLNSTKDVAVPNLYGVGIKNTGNKLGLEGKGNLISGNDIGILLYTSASYDFSNNNSIQYNFIGTDKAGVEGIPNGVGLEISGNNCSDNIISDNMISGNTGDGISIQNGSNNNSFFRNSIGINNNNEALGNGGVGIRIDGNNNYIGDGEPENLNQIAFNSKGIALLNSYYVYNNRISLNNIFSNGLGIDLGDDNVTANDINDSDLGANNLQNYPVLLKSNLIGSQLEIEFQIDSDPKYSIYPLTIEIFKSDGNRQGEEYLGSVEVFNLPKGKKNLITSIGIPSGNTITEGDLIVATATDALGNTSEFSEELPVNLSGSCTTETFYADTDGDGLGDPANLVEECSLPQGYVSNADDCDDRDPEIGAAKNWYLDWDGDGFGDPYTSIQECTQPSGYVLDNTDCNDKDASIYPGALDDTADGKDQDCDGFDGPVTSCSGADNLLVSEICSTNTSIEWQIENPGTCTVTGRWELRKMSSTGDSSGSFELAPGEIYNFTSGTVSKGKTQLVVYWNDRNGLELNTSLNATGIECTQAQASMSEPLNDLYISPNPISDEAIGMYFTQPLNEGELQVKIYSSSGNLIATENLLVPTGTTSVSLGVDHSSWLEGVYILNASINGQNYRVQFIK
ncbi:MopE-related protein [Gramella sp. KN1008]|uniref:MopE-related protein n=1 Tax=Gramella sp. KN1008 TaxID=2529298 RepID=UPI001A94FD4E|nr:MopE-related protein [Gramella sp. KN1008]